ncbi:MAG: hypothetical protein P4M02_07560 [Clostridia bacterium]|nr:hypothetical protein [Clostridia bacterium]
MNAAAGKSLLCRLVLESLFPAAPGAGREIDRKTDEILIHQQVRGYHAKGKGGLPQADYR